MLFVAPFIICKEVGNENIVPRTETAARKHHMWHRNLVVWVYGISLIQSDFYFRPV